MPVGRQAPLEKAVGDDVDVTQDRLGSGHRQQRRVHVPQANVELIALGIGHEPYPSVDVTGAAVGAEADLRVDLAWAWLPPELECAAAELDPALEELVLDQKLGALRAQDLDSGQRIVGSGRRQHASQKVRRGGPRVAVARAALDELLVQDAQPQAAAGLPRDRDRRSVQDEPLDTETAGLERGGDVGADRGLRHMEQLLAVARPDVEVLDGELQLTDLGVPAQSRRAEGDSEVRCRVSHDRAQRRLQHRQRQRARRQDDRERDQCRHHRGRQGGQHEADGVEADADHDRRPVRRGKRLDRHPGERHLPASAQDRGS